MYQTSAENSQNPYLKDTACTKQSVSYQYHFTASYRYPALHGHVDTGARGTHIGKAEETDRGRICRTCVSAC